VLKQVPFSTVQPHSAFQPPELTILMPCLDEARTIGACVDQAKGFLKEHGIAGEVLVADNGSQDGSREFAESRGARVVLVRKRGYGAALAGGVAEARGRYVIVGDSDLSYDWSDLRAFLERLRGGDDLVMGNRFQGGIQEGAMPFLHRYLGNPFLSALGRCFFGSSCGDFYCGQRGFSRASFRLMDLRSSGMEFALEMLVKATLLGLKVTEVPVKLRRDGRGRRSHLRTWNDGWRSLCLFLSYAPRWLFLYPGLLLLSLGCSLGALLVGGPRVLGGLRFDVHALLYCAGAATVGLQLVLLFCFAKMLAWIAGMHPVGRTAERIVRTVRLEHGLAAGGILALAGLAGAIWAASDVDPEATVRIAIPSALLLTIGCQVIFGSFLFGMLKLQWRERLKLEDWTRDRALQEAA
jgi:hypothetical protein